MTGANCASDAISGWPTSLICGSAGSSPSDGGSGLSLVVNGSPGPVGVDERCHVAELGIDDRPLERAIQVLTLAVELNRQSQQQEQKRMQENAHAP